MRIIKLLNIILFITLIFVNLSCELYEALDNTNKECSSDRDCGKDYFCYKANSNDYRVANNEDYTYLKANSKINYGIDDHHRMVSVCIKKACDDYPCGDGECKHIVSETYDVYKGSPICICLDEKYKTGIQESTKCLTEEVTCSSSKDCVGVYLYKDSSIKTLKNCLTPGVCSDICNNENCENEDETCIKQETYYKTYTTCIIDKCKLENIDCGVGTCDNFTTQCKCPIDSFRESTEGSKCFESIDCDSNEACADIVKVTGYESGSETVDRWLSCSLYTRKCVSGSSYDE